jgi:hypothetical protein
MAGPPSAKARTELNVAIGYVDRATRRLAGEPGYVCQARTLERLSAELAEVLARLIAADHRQAREPAP